MNLKTIIIKEAFAVKLTAEEDNKEVGRAFLYILKNDLHKESFGFLEDVFVEEAYRSKGIGKQLVLKTIEEAKAQGCYKLICTARTFKGEVHGFYEHMGFKRWGYEFRINF